MGFTSVLIISITVRLSVRIQVDISVRQDSRHRRLRQCPLFVGLKARVEESLIKQAVSVYNKLQKTVCLVVRGLIINDCKININVQYSSTKVDNIHAQTLTFN